MLTNAELTERRAMKLSNLLQSVTKNTASIDGNAVVSGAADDRRKHVFPAIRENSMAWIPVTYQLPKGGFPVLVACGKKVLRAAHAWRFELDEENWGLFNDGDGSDYNEVTDMTYWPEGWYEWNEFEEIHWRLESEPTHWMPLPEAPNAVNSPAAQRSGEMNS